jgi:alkylation response protein AidB-like acyl-CoA dehydrogenase
MVEKQIYLVIAQTDREKGHKGINVLIVEKGMPGFHRWCKRR